MKKCGREDMLGAEDKQSGSESASSTWSLLRIKSGISSSSTAPVVKEQVHGKKQPRGWKAMPYILGLF